LDKDIALILEELKNWPEKLPDIKPFPENEIKHYSVT